MNGETEPILPSTAASSGSYEAAPQAASEGGSGGSSAFGKVGERLGRRLDELKHARKSLTGAFVDYHDSSHALCLCVSLLIGYLVLGVVAYTYIFEKGSWTIIDSLYFSVVTFTTVGYGDLTPSTDGSQIFTIFFVLIGIAIVGVALGLLGERFLDRRDEAVDAVKSAAQRRVVAMFSSSSSSTDGEDGAGQERALIQPAKAAGDDIKEFLLHETPIFLVIFLLAINIGWWEGWTYLESIYFGIVTTTTVGYGDFTPDTQAMRVYAIFFLPLAVVVVCNLLGRIAGIYLDRQAARSEERFLARELTLQDLQVMDVDSDGSVSMMEFVSFMLVAMQKVDKESVDELKDLFRTLDVDGSGSLQKEDLIMMAKSRSEGLAVADGVVA